MSLYEQIFTITELEMLVIYRPCRCGFWDNPPRVFFLKVRGVGIYYSWTMGSCSKGTEAVNIPSRNIPPISCNVNRVINYSCLVLNVLLLLVGVLDKVQAQVYHEHNRGLCHKTWWTIECIKHVKCLSTDDPKTEMIMF